MTRSCCEVFEIEWNRLIDTLLEQGIVVQCFYVSEDMMPNDIRRVVFRARGRTVPVERAPWLMAGKYAFEAFRNEAVCADCSLPEKE